MDTFGRAYTHRGRSHRHLAPAVAAQGRPQPVLQPPRPPPAAERARDRDRRRAPGGRRRAAGHERRVDRAPPDRPRGHRRPVTKHQAVVILYYLEGRSLQETADALDLPLGTVKSRVHHALRDLRMRLNEDRRFGGAWGEAPRIIEAEAVEAGGS